MPSLSVITVSRGRPLALDERLAASYAALKGLTNRLEFICVLDGYANDGVALTAPREDRPWRVLASRVAIGLTAAVRAGLAVSSSDFVAMLPLDGPYAPDSLTGFWSKMARFDVVFAKRNRGALGRRWQRLARAPRLLRGVSTLHDPDPRIWMGRTEAVATWRRCRAHLRDLPGVAASRRYRIGEMVIRSSQKRSTIGDLSWQLKHDSKSGRADAFTEIEMNSEARASLKSA